MTDTESKTGKSLNTGIFKQYPRVKNGRIQTVSFEIDL